MLYAFGGLYASFYDYKFVPVAVKRAHLVVVFIFLKCKKLSLGNAMGFELNEFDRDIHTRTLFWFAVADTGTGLTTRRLLDTLHNVCKRVRHGVFLNVF